MAIATSLLFLPGFSGRTPQPGTIGGAIVSSGADLESGAMNGMHVVPAAGGELALVLQPQVQQGEYLSQPQEAPFDFNALGLHWKADLPAGTQVDAEVRCSRDGEAWEDWVKVNVDDMEMPDHIADTATAGETFGQLVFADRARFFQYRFKLTGDSAGQSPAVTRVTASYIDAKGYHESPISAAGIERRAAALIKPAPADAAPTVISRAEWGADESLMQWDPEYSPVKKIIIHHTAGSNYDPDPAATVRSIYHYHAVPIDQGGLGWGDIGYNFLIDAQGMIYEGRYGGNAVIGGHAYGWNTGTIGIAALGNYEEADITPAVYNSFVDLMAWKANVNHVDPLGNDAMNGSNPPNILGHRDVYATACPGAFLYPYLTQLRNDVYERYGTKILSFAIPGQAGETTIDQSAHTVALTMPYGTNVTSLVPTITHTGASVSPASGVAHDFTNPTTYTVTGEDASIQDYTVMVTIAVPPKTIDSFTITNQIGPTAIDQGTHTVDLTMPYGTDVTALAPAIGISGASVSPVSGAAHNFTAPSAYTVSAADGSTQAYTVTVTVAPPARNYYWTWYDNYSSMNWLLMANPAGAAQPVYYDYQVGANDMSLYADSPPSGSIAAGASAPARFYNTSGLYAGMGMVGGPVRATSEAGDAAIASQRSLWKGGNSLEEVPGTETARMSDHYYWTWYDNRSDGMYDWVMISNPDAVSTVNYRIKIGGAVPVTALEGAARGSIGPGSGQSARFDLKTGPVEVESCLASFGADDQPCSDPVPPKVVASQRVLTNTGTPTEAFNEVPGVPAGELTNDYLWTWYDNASPGVYDWVLVANPNAYPINYRITVKGAVPAQMIEGEPAGIIAPGSNVTPRFANLADGPLEVKTCKLAFDGSGNCPDAQPADGRSIASQRTIWGPSFEEVPGYPRSALAGDYHWTWYDQFDAGTYDWVHIINTNGFTIFYRLTVGGALPAPVVEGAATGSIAAGELVHPRFMKRGGPVEVRTCSAAFNPDGSCSGDNPPVMTSQRVLWHGFFNEVLGSVLD